jgi:hypothetical protein
MPKRKSEDYITRKIKKWEKKLRKRSRKISSCSSSDTDVDVALSRQEGMSEYVFHKYLYNIKELIIH